MVGRWCSIVAASGLHRFDLSWPYRVLQNIRASSYQFICTIPGTQFNRKIPFMSGRFLYNRVLHVSV